MDEEYGICDMCGNKGIIQRRYYHFDIRCECHLPNHFEIVHYCKDCVPIMPPETYITLHDEALDRDKTFKVDTELLQLLTYDRQF